MLPSQVWGLLLPLRSSNTEQLRQQGTVSGQRIWEHSQSGPEIEPLPWDVEKGTESLRLCGIAVTTNLAFHKGRGRSIICTYIEAGTEAAHPGTDSKGWGKWVEFTAASDLVWPGTGSSVLGCRVASLTGYTLLPVPTEISPLSTEISATELSRFRHAQEQVSRHKNFTRKNLSTYRLHRSTKSGFRRLERQLYST